MKILIIKFRNIGDVLLSTPLIENLKLSYPNAQIDFALNDYCIDMIEENPNINNIFPYYRSRFQKMSFFKRIAKELQYFNTIKSMKYDIVINLTKGDRGSFLSLLSGAKIKIGYKSDNILLKILKPFTYNFNDDIKHTIEKDLDALLFLNKNIKNKNLSIYWAKKSEKKVKKLLDKYNISEFIHIHPVSRWMFKCWEDDRMANIIDYIQNTKKIKVILSASTNENESKRMAKIISLCKTSPINLSGQLSLKDIAYLSSKAKLFFGVDTAPMHIAAAVKTKTFALMGASEPLCWGPWDSNQFNNNYKNTDGIQRMGDNTVISNMNHTIFYDNGIKKCKGMVQIDIKDVKRIFDEYL
jgi:heptosyltransferase-3